MKNDFYNDTISKVGICQTLENGKRLDSDRIKRRKVESITEKMS